MKVRPEVHNKGTSSEYYVLISDENNVLNYAPNNWKTAKGAMNWAKKHGYIEEDKKMKNNKKSPAKAPKKQNNSVRKAKTTSSPAKKKAVKQPAAKQPAKVAKRPQKQARISAADRLRGADDVYLTKKHIAIRKVHSYYDQNGKYHYEDKTTHIPQTKRNMNKMREMYGNSIRRGRS